MAEKMYFKDGDSVYQAHFLDEGYPEDPRNPDFCTNLGTMVFKKKLRYELGDEQVEDFGDFFRDQISEKEPNDYFEGFIEFELPTLEQAQNDENLSRFIAGTEESGYRFDKELYAQEMDYILSSIKDSLGESVCNDISGGIPIDEKTNFLTDTYRIDLRTADCAGYTKAENCLNEIKSELSSRIKNLAPKNWFNYTEDSIHAFNRLDDLTESQLFDKWAQTKLCVIPINFFEHSGITVHEAAVRKTLRAANDRDDGDVYNDGFIYIDKDNQEVLNELKGEARDSEGKVYNTWKAKTSEEVKNWAEENLRSEIKTYASYLEGDVHSLEVEEFNRETLDWDILENQSCSMVFGSDLKSELKSLGYKIDNVLTEEQIKQLLNTPTPEFKKACWNEFIESVRKALPEFDNKPEYASAAVLYSMNQKGSLELNKKALNEYMKEIGCDSREKTVSVLKEALALNKEKSQSQNYEQESLKDFDPYTDGGKQFEIYFSTNHNPEASNYKSKRAPNHVLVVDTENKRYGLLTGAYSIDGDHFDDYKNKPDLSTKKLREKIEHLETSGFKFQKFTSERGVYSQGDPKKLYPKSRQKDLNIGIER